MINADIRLLKDWEFARTASGKPYVIGTNVENDNHMIATLVIRGRDGNVISTVNQGGTNHCDYYILEAPKNAQALEELQAAFPR